MTLPARFLAIAALGWALVGLCPLAAQPVIARIVRMAGEDPETLHVMGRHFGDAPEEILVLINDLPISTWILNDDSEIIVTAPSATEHTTLAVHVRGVKALKHDGDPLGTPAVYENTNEAAEGLWSFEALAADAELGLSPLAGPLSPGLPGSSLGTPRGPLRPQVQGADVAIPLTPLSPFTPSLPLAGGTLATPRRQLLFPPIKSAGDARTPPSAGANDSWSSASSGKTPSPARPVALAPKPPEAPRSRPTRTSLRPFIAPAQAAASANVLSEAEEAALLERVRAEDALLGQRFRDLRQKAYDQYEAREQKREAATGRRAAAVAAARLEQEAAQTGHAERYAARKLARDNRKVAAANGQPEPRPGEAERPARTLPPHHARSEDRQAAIQQYLAGYAQVRAEAARLGPTAAHPAPASSLPLIPAMKATSSKGGAGGRPPLVRARAAAPPAAHRGVLLDPDTWEQRRAEVLKYTETPPYQALVPYAYLDPDSGSKLGLWVRNQRTYYRLENSCMTPARIASLEKLPGWDWDPPPDPNGSAPDAAAWMDQYEKLKAHLEEPGASAIFIKEHPLYFWTHKQRLKKKDGTLKKQREDLLNLLRPGWQWEIPHQKGGPKVDDALWLIHLDELRDFLALHGEGQLDYKAKAAGGFKLGEWFNDQRKARRKGKLSQAREKALAGVIDLSRYN